MTEQGRRRRIQRKHMAFDVTKKASRRTVNGLVAQVVGHVPIATMLTGEWYSIAHQDVVIKPNENLAVINVNELVFTEFVFKPKLPGFYLIHHQRRESIYAPTTTGSYTVSLRLLATSDNGIVDEIANETSAITGGAINDVARISLTAMVYLDGVDDEVKIQVRHNFTSLKTFGSIVSENSKAHTTIMYAGSNPEHGYVE